MHRGLAAVSGTDQPQDVRMKQQEPGEPKC